MDSIRLFAEHTPHKRMKENAVRLHVHIMHFACIFTFVSHSHTVVDAALLYIILRLIINIIDRFFLNFLQKNQ